MMLQNLSICYLMILASLISSCDQTQKINLQVSTHDNLKNPVTNAMVTLNHKQIGETDLSGLFDKEIELPRERPLRIEISKSSESHYYAPYFETLSIDEIEQKKAIKVQAVLYHVPKTPMGSDDDLAQDDDPAHESQIETTSNSPTENPDGQQLQEHSLSPEEIKSETFIDEDKIKNQKQAVILKQEESDPSSSFVDESQNLKPFPLIPHSFKEAMMIPDFPVTIYKDMPDILKYTSPKAVHSIDFNISVFSGKKPIKNAEIYMGSADTGTLQYFCKTGRLGLCSKKIPWRIGGTVTYKIKKNGFVTQTVQRKISANKNISFRVNLPYQKSLDLFILHQRFSKLAGVPDTDLFINHRKIGKTDSFGHFTWLYQGHHEDLLKLSFRNNRYLPELFASDFVIGEHQTITKTVTRKEFLKARVYLSESLLFLNKKVKNITRSQLKQLSLDHLKQINGIQLISSESTEKELEELGVSTTQFLNDGWNHLNLRSSPDFAISSYVLSDDTGPYILYLMKGSSGTIASSAVAKISLKDSPLRIQKSVENALSRLLNQGPVSGPVIGVKEQSILFETSPEHISLIDPKKQLHIYGVTIDRNGQRKSPSLVAKARIDNKLTGKDQATVIWRTPRSLLSRGDMILFNQEDDQIYSNLTIKDAGDFSVPVPHMSIFSGNQWVGVTNESGQTLLRQNYKKSSAQPMVYLKAGYKPLRVPSLTQKNILATRDRLVVHVDTVPPGSQIYLAKNYAGRSPAQLSLDSGAINNIELDIKGPPGYESRKFHIRPTFPLTDLTGPDAIHLEPERLSIAEMFFKQKQWKKAIHLLDKIPDDHPDSFKGRHLSGYIRYKYLNDNSSAIKDFEILFEKIKALKVSQKTGLWEAGLSLATALSSQFDHLTLQQDRDKITSLARKINSVLKEASLIAPVNPANHKLSLQFTYIDLISQTYLTENVPGRPFNDTLRKKWLEFMVAAKSLELPDHIRTTLLNHASKVSESNRYIR